MFHVPDVDPKSPRNRFLFTVPRRKWWERSKFSIPHMHLVPLTVMAEARQVDAPEQLGRILELMGETAAVEAIGRLSQPEIRHLEVAWLEASAPGLGELAASLSLSQSMRGPSEAISSETDSDSTG
jgi:hypothetical protein